MPNFEMYLSVTWNLFYETEDAYRCVAYSWHLVFIFHFECEGRELASPNISDKPSGTQMSLVWMCGGGSNLMMPQGSVLFYKLALRQRVLQGWSRLLLRMCLVWHVCPTWDGCLQGWGWEKPHLYVLLDHQSTLFTYRVNSIRWHSRCKGCLDYPLPPKIKWNFFGGKLGSEWSKLVKQDR